MTDHPSDDNEDDSSKGSSTQRTASDTISQDDEASQNVVVEAQIDKMELLKTLVGLNDIEFNKLKDAGYTKAEDLALLGAAASDTLKMFRGSAYKLPLVKVHNLEIYATYLLNGGPLDHSTTINDMARYNINIEKGSKSPQPSDDEGIGLQKSDGVPKYHNDTTKFEEYWDGLVRYLMATPLGHYLDNKPTTQGTSKTRKTASNRNNALHWHLYQAFLHTDGDHVVRDAGQKYNKSGFHTARVLLNHFRPADQRAAVQRRIWNEITKLTYDGFREDVPTVQHYINKFKLLMQRLELAKEFWDDTKKKAEFLRGLQPESGTPLATIKIMLRRDDTKTYDASMKDVLATANDEEFDAEQVQHSKGRRTPSSGIDNKPFHTTAPSNTVEHFPFIPDHVVGEMRKARDGQSAVSILLKWRRINNTEQRTIRPDELHGWGKPTPKPDTKRKRNTKRKRRTKKSNPEEEKDSPKMKPTRKG